MSKRKDDLSAENLESLEAHLAGTLRPVSPPMGVAQRLRERIHFPDRETLVIRLSDWKRLFLAFGSVMSAMLLLITIARALYYLVGRRDMG